MNKKQFLLPLVILLISAGAYWGALQLKKPPVEKEVVDNTPLVTVQVIEASSIDFAVGSYGVVKSQFETDLVAQVSGEIRYLSKKFVRGGFVKKGEILAKIDANDYQAALIDAQANIASAEAALVLEIANANVAKEQWRKIKGSKPTSLSLREPQVAQEKARLLSSQAGLKRAKRNVERTIIRAPYDALIHTRLISLGSYASIGTALGQVLSTDIAELRLPVADSEMQYLMNSGDNAKVILDATISGVKQTWSGVVVRNEGVIDARSHMNYLVVQVKDPYQLRSKDAEKLRFGTYVTARISGKKIDNVSVINQHLITNSQVAIVNKQGLLHFQAINIARVLDGKAYVNKGLSDGMQVITSALDYPIEGMPLLIKEKTIEHTALNMSATELSVHQADK
ncbi:efflux RND transporter periplasmic adaptor subunit [Psychromonas sp. Urea-02u-13]|uniref:efflux RND transporter periplasmic adaptor subunit n=1 Tax=Psychromonas sp. Urea-02u-13 TaxID=2058326 RepID=UPI000C332205|nr:efflux RND transporter periplasmic adaptor subunit [Psychromonas sp. Urea-02u-13]PKG38732.1 efflux RND transporter periplasmic adaptor subunit [Psychromonas sp. Urea-02u-13]